NYRLSGVNERLYKLLSRYRFTGMFEGHIESSPLFWGDLCRERIRYVRNFVFPDLNTLKACPWMPYHDASRPYVNAGVASSEGGTVDAFIRTISEGSQDRLEAEGGACIMYTHLAQGFYQNGQLQHRFRALMERLSRKNGWFVPVTMLLDH